MGGLYGTIGGRTMYDINKEVLTGAKAVVAYGTCACFGGVPAAAPNPSGCKGVNECFSKLGINAINIAGCPPNPLNLVGALAALLSGVNLELDSLNRPKAFYGHTVHELCERLPHFEAGEFAPSFNSEEARNGWCLYKLGCKGPMTYNNCPKALFNDESWPVAAGHPCIGCSEPNFWDKLTPFYEN
jgi:[NiFe] hydrogenase small subunit